jgi:uncharacterized SAM-binding protein YcdF (DUF218 family)
MSADWLVASGLGTLKPVVEALLLPPVPLLALALAGAWVARRRPRAGGGLVVLACVLLWLCACTGAARWAERHLLDESTPLDAAQRLQLKARAAAGEPLAIVVLGGGMESDAKEYGGGDLALVSYSRLRYGVWLGRQTGVPVAASGGLGWGGGGADEPTEAAQMARIAQAEFGLPLRWTETTSRDTHENAVNTITLLRAAGVREILLVTTGAHMARALREFRAAAAAAEPSLAITPAAMGQAWPAQPALLRWMPSGEGALRMRGVMHEVLGTIALGR